MDDRLQSIIRGLVSGERSRRKDIAARSMAQVVEGIPMGHGRLPLVVDREAAAEYELRAKQWLAIATRVVRESGATWTQGRAQQIESAIRLELIADWEELVELVRSRTRAAGNGRIEQLEAAKHRMESDIHHELELLVLAQDVSRVPIDEQLASPRYASVLLALKKARLALNEQTPDSPNAAKDAVSAVEQLARIVTESPTATLGEAIRQLRGAGRVQAPLLDGVQEIWGWSSSTPSVRHGSTVELVVNLSTARYVLGQAEAAIALLLSVDTA